MIVWIKENIVRFKWKVCEWCDRCNRYFNIFKWI